MKNALVVSGVLCLMVFVVGCGSEKKEKANGAGNASAKGENSEKQISLEVADLEKLKTWEDFGKANASLTGKLVDVMDSVQDKASAEAAIASFKELAPKFAAVNRAEKAAGEPSKDDRKMVLEILAAANKRFNESYEKLSANEELFSIVSEALDKAYVGDDS